MPHSVLELGEETFVFVAHVFQCLFQIVMSLHVLTESLHLWVPIKTLQSFPYWLRNLFLNQYASYASRSDHARQVRFVVKKRTVVGVGIGQKA